MAEREYIRLARPRVRSGFHVSNATRSSLWLGKDHLLCVETNGFTETYKRFYFRDIQAIFIRRTIRRKTWNWILGTLAAMCVLAWSYDLIFGSGVSAAGIVTGTIFTTLFGVPLLINNLLGPTCVCRLRTAVQEDEVPALNRDKRFKKIMERVRPLIEEAQGLLPREEIPARMQELAAQNQPRLVVDDPNLPPRMVG